MIVCTAELQMTHTSVCKEHVMIFTKRLFVCAEAAGFRTPHVDRGREEDPGCWGLPGTQQTSSDKEWRESTEESQAENKKQGNDSKDSKHKEMRLSYDDYSLKRQSSRYPLHSVECCLSFCPDLSSGESEEEEGVCGMSGEEVRLGKNLSLFFFLFLYYAFWFTFVTVMCSL